MIEQTLAKWHRFVAGELPGGLDELLAEDVVFHSPVVFTPQKGREITKVYLNAAAETLGGPDGNFHYTKEVVSGRHAVLEFEAEVEGKWVNGVDILSFDAEGRIREFRVMVRPLQAVNVLHRQMAAMLERLKRAGGG